MSADYCAACAEIAAEITAPGGIIFDDGLWYVSHHTGAFTDPGELIVKTRRHCESLADLTEAEAKSLGPILRAGVGALEGGMADAEHPLVAAQRANAPRPFSPASSYRWNAPRARRFGPVPKSTKPPPAARAAAESQRGSPRRSRRTAAPQVGLPLSAAAATMTARPPLAITRLQSQSDAEACARLMATSDPWLTLGRTYDSSLRIVLDPSREVYVARDQSGLAGFLILCMTGAFVGYIQTVLVHPDRRGQGLGSRLVQFAEDRILAESPNIFMCVSSFNQAAGRLYQRLGYKVVGELTDYIIAGHSEILLRKSIGPLSGYEPTNRGIAPAGERR